MGKVIRKKIQGMSWWMKTTLVLLLTLGTTVFMYEGWYKPMQATAAVGQPTAWTQQYASATYPAGTVGANFSISAGTNRLLVVAIASTATAATSQTVSNVTWNGQALTLANGDGASTATANHTYLYYLKDASMPAATTAAPLNVTISGGTSYYTYVYAAVFDGVNQSGNPFTDSKNYNSGGTGDTTMGPYSPGLTIAANDQAIMIANNARVSAGTTARTITGQSDASWSTATVAATYNAVSGPCVGLAIRNRNTLTALTDTSTFTISNTAWDSMTAMSITPAPAGSLSITNGTDPVSANAPQASTGNAMDAFSVFMSAGSGTINTLTLTGSAQFLSTNVAAIKVYRDNGVVGVLDGPDVLVPTTTSWASNVATVTFTTPESVTTATGNYLVVVDVAATATVTNTLSGTVTAVTGTSLGTPAYGDTGSGTLTVTAGAGLTVGNGTNPANANAPQNSTSNALDSFTMVSTAGTATINTLTLTGSANFTATNISGIKVYADNGTIGTFDGADVLIPTTYTLSGTTATITFTTPQSVSTTAQNYLVLVDVPAGATLAQTFTGTVTAVTGSGYVSTSYTDTSSATLTVSAAQTLTVGNGTNPANANAKTSGSTALDAFTLNLNAGTGTVNTLTLTGSANFTTANISGVSVYADNGVIGTYEAGTDTLIPTTYSQAGTVGTITFSTSEPVTTTAKNYLVLVTVAGGATLNQTFTGTITAATGAGIGTPTYSDTASATLTIVAGPIATITSCNGCHFNPTVADGTARNNPIGQFPGSHAKHAASGANQYAFACTKCHRNNTTYNHQNGRINMAVPIGGTTGAIYNNVTSFPISNSPIFGNCANSYCHSNGTGGTLQSGDTRGIVANTSLSWGTVNGPGGTGNENYTSNCSITCHSGRPSYTNYTSATALGKKANTHGYAGRGTTHSQQTCDVCHSSVTTSDGGVTYAFTSYTTHANGRYNLKSSFGYTYNAKRGGTCASPPTGCHGTAIWGGQLTCINCHNSIITRTVGRAAGTTLAAVTTEFGLAYGHKKSGRGAVTNLDCVVCHLEGWGYGSANGAGSINTTYHKNGNIDLRDPVGSGETPITNISGAAFTFQRFSTSYAAGTRTSTGHQSNTDIANVVTQKFCLGCHRSTGATNPTARTAGGTAYMPWGGVNLGANYTVANGASVAGGIVNVFSQFSTGNSSYHPVRGPLNKDFPTPALLNAPYNNFTRTGTAGAKTLGVVINCFDCHNNNTGTLLTKRTIAAHGTNNTAQVRGTIYSNGTGGPTLCTSCHTGYTTDFPHPAGSAASTFSGGGSEGMGTYCGNCHASGLAAASSTGPARPIPAFDYHGFNKLLGGSNWPGAGYGRPYAFIRNNIVLTNHRPNTASDITTGSPNCDGTGKTCANGSVSAYSPGGAY
jgi:predicted CxxxxCH...CXXCH cytochrome family protein